MKQCHILIKGQLTKITHMYKSVTEKETNGKWDRRQELEADCEHNTTMCLHKQVIKKPIVHIQKKPVSNGQPKPTKIITVLCVQKRND